MAFCPLYSFLLQGYADGHRCRDGTVDLVILLFLRRTAVIHAVNVQGAVVKTVCDDRIR